MPAPKPAPPSDPTRASWSPGELLPDELLERFRGRAADHDRENTFPHDDLAELFGYVIREGVTNVVRHSRATRAEITVDEHSVSVQDDGIGIPEGAVRTGLQGLEARVALAGGRLEVRSGETGTRLAVTMGEAP